MTLILNMYCYLTGPLHNLKRYVYIRYKNLTS